MTNKVPSEHIEQREFVKWFRRNYQARILAIPNGGNRNPSEAARLKAEGVSAGVPDLFIPEWRLWIEMKRTKGGAVSPEQKDWMQHLQSVNYECIVAKGVEDAKAKILEFLDKGLQT